MKFSSEFVPLPLDQLRREAAVKKADGWRFVQTHAVSTDAGVDLYYSFMKDGHALNYQISGVTPDKPVPSITDLFIAAFVFENEARELFGVDMRDIAIDFGGAMYGPVDASPMTFITPEQKAAREKAKKAAAGRPAERAASGTDGAGKTASPRAFVLSEEKRAQLEERLATMPPEKVAKVRAALAAREAAATAGPAPEAAKRADAKDEPKPQAGGEKATAKGGEKGPGGVQPAKDAVLEEKIAGLDPAKAAKVKAAIAAKAARDAGASAADLAAKLDEAPAEALADEQLEQLLNNMEDAKAAKVRAALSSIGGK